MVSYKIHLESHNILSKLVLLYIKKKEVLYSKHREVLKYLEDKTYDIDLSEIYEKINEGLDNKPYNIYISNDSFIIKNTTFKADLGFDLSFMESNLLKHHKDNVVGNYPPMFETSSKKFLSYTDSILPNTKNSILQISYTYDELDDSVRELKNIIDYDKSIKDAFVYIIAEDGLIGDFIYKNFPPRKLSLEQMTQRIKKGENIYKSLKDKNQKGFSVIQSIEDSTERYYHIEHSDVQEGITVIYEIIFSLEEHKSILQKLHISFILILFFGILTIVSIFNYRRKEYLLKQKDQFIEYAFHEIKIPLSIMSLNLELRNKHIGEDKYSHKIEGALRTLKNSYEDMSFLQTKDNIIYDKETVNLKNVLIDRVNYFNVIAKNQSRLINLDINDDFYINISQIELERLIDNNLSNAIKYSFINSEIIVSFEKSVLKFTSLGKSISDTTNIFDKYTRENSSVGGHGLGLSIVKDICIKYKIEFYVDSNEDKTTFCYKLKEGLIS